jgi:hypothetical protein
MNNNIKRVIRGSVKTVGKNRIVRCFNECTVHILLHKDAFANDRKEHFFKDMNMRERALHCRKKHEKSTLLQRTGNYPVEKEQATYMRNLECDQLQSSFKKAVTSDLTKSSYMRY